MATTTLSIPVWRHGAIESRVLTERAVGFSGSPFLYDGWQQENHWIFSFRW